jgi:anion-transporting  ArsA/GET3 family ATPase
MSRLGTELQDSRLVVCVGAGGVGKTTVAAAVAVGLAARGRRVALLTVDSAPRLAALLGLDELHDQPQRVSPGRLAAAGVSPTAEIWAMSLDVKETFDEVVGALAPDPGTREQILANRVYRQLSGPMGGSRDYATMAKLFAVSHAPDYDVVVLDGPDSRSTLDLLRTPQRLGTFLEGRALPFFMRPSGSVMRAAGLLLAALGRILGLGMLDELTGFFRLLFAKGRGRPTAGADVLDGLRERAHDVRVIFRDPATAFLVLSLPDAGASNEAIHLTGELEREGAQRLALVVNRVRPLEEAGFDVPATTARLTPALGSGLAGRVAADHAQLQLLALRQRAARERLESAIPQAPILQLCDRGPDVDDAATLVAMQAELLG